MEFRTQLSNLSSATKMAYQEPILGIGSCFIENIGSLLQTYKFPTLLNPFGILYNPFSIHYCLERLLENRPYTAKELIDNKGIWYSFDHHGRFSSTDPNTAIELINHSFQEAVTFLKNTKWLIVTLGTATVYRYKTTKKVVANCHKLPNSQFTKERLSVAQIVDTLSTTFEALQKNRPATNILLTVSPVRHIKDGIIENQRSKATLLLAVDQLVNQFEQVSYFPAYELVMDDLRDYRFFEKDLVHPNQLAVAYIWEAFEQAYFTESTSQLKNKILKIVNASQHRPFHPNSPQHQQFIKKQLIQIELLEASYPYLSFEKEKNLLKG